MGHAFLVTDTPEGKRLRHAQVTWGAATTEQVAFETTLRAANFRRQEGLVGRAWSTGRTIWAADCIKRWPGDRLRAAGLEPAFAFPMHIHLLGRVFKRQRAQAAQAATQQLLEEKVLERTAELESMARLLAEPARLKDEFLAAISHERRTPLTAILGFSEVMLAHAHGPLNGTQTKAMTFLDGGAPPARPLQDQHGPGVAGGNLDPARRLVPGHTVQMVQPLAAERRLSLELRLPDHLPPLWGEERRLRQVFLNYSATPSNSPSRADR